MSLRNPTALSRRQFVRGATLLGCSAAAWPLTTHVTLAATPGEHRLVVIILRGGMDGLDVLRPVGDPAFAGLRGTGLTGDRAGLDLDGFFALHPSLDGLMPLWREGSLAFAHAVATPYRKKRSHFDGQDILEAGTGLDVPDSQVRDGWLNRLVQVVPGTTAETAYAIGLDQLKVIAGPAPVSRWNPDTEFDLDDQSRRLLERLYEDDPLFHAASAAAFDLNEGAGMGDGTTGGNASRQLAEFAAGRLRDSARIAAFSINGWDTHRNQGRVLRTRLKRLTETLTTLRDELGAEVWSKTTVLAMTEFGRTVRENGTKGTDHGTGGAMLIAGGAVRGGRVLGDWPGLSEGALYEGRDLMPTRDVRAYAAWAMRGLYGIDTGLLETQVFQGLEMGSDPGVLL